MLFAKPKVKTESKKTNDVRDSFIYEQGGVVARSRSRLYDTTTELTFVY